MRALWLIGVAAYRELWRSYGATLVVLTLLSQGLVLSSGSPVLAAISSVLMGACAFAGLPAITASGLSRWLNLKPLAASGPLAGDYKVATAYGLAAAAFALPFAALVAGVDGTLLHQSSHFAAAYPCSTHHLLDGAGEVATAVLPTLLALGWLGAAAGRASASPGWAVWLAWGLSLLVYGGELFGASETPSMPMFRDLFPAAVGPALFAQVLLALAVLLPIRRPALVAARS